MSENLSKSSTPDLHTQLCTCTPRPVRETSFAACLKDCSYGSDESVRAIAPVPAFLRREEEDGRRSNGILTRAGAWLRGKCITKRLRVAETISLGEKRFVAIVSVEGKEFLIGGGSAGMSLLAQLGDTVAVSRDVVAQMRRSGGAQ